MQHGGCENWDGRVRKRGLEVDYSRSSLMKSLLDSDPPEKNHSDPDDSAESFLEA